ncbi:hypothetical protein LIER_23978 [Lithospermum erythrorhizon]|uniref:Uncharacterized protein n=1 Tax=Lithospermum erythrorhizon TaxID=34254 RepID=A0AAV3R0N3_LITER
MSTYPNKISNSIIGYRRYEAKKVLASIPEMISKDEEKLPKRSTPEILGTNCMEMNKWKLWSSEDVC